VNWTHAGFDLLGQRVLWIDVIGNACALTTVVFAIKRTIWTWPIQLTGSALLFVASISAHVTGNALKQAMFGVLALYGWSRGTRGGASLAVRPADGRERLILTAVMAAGTVAVAAVFTLTGWSWAPWPDAYIFVGSAVATYAQGRALIDFWWIWMAVDVVGVPLLFSSGLVVSGLVYGVFFVLVVIGFRDWLRRYRTLEVAAA
jgi:nicotinamide mononucleotide transporter